MQHRTRRAFVESLAGALTYGFMPPTVEAASHSGTRIGAIRWDAWYGESPAEGSSEWVARHNLDPVEFHERAPFFAETIGKRLKVQGSREDLDLEIKYAAAAGVAYWAFGWYGNDRPLHLGWSYYQESKYRSLINWCVLIGTKSLQLRFPPHEELTSYFKQSNYENVSGRPLLFINHESADLKQTMVALTALRKSCKNEGCGNPLRCHHAQRR